MIFKSISDITKTKEKGFFIEKINLYIRIVQVFAQKNSTSLELSDSEIKKSTITELIAIGVISEPDNLEILKRVIDKQLFIDFICSVNFAIKYKKQLIGLLFKLRNASRKTLQEKAISNKAPRLIDFFCGAGGLSLGFVQEGFQIDLANDHEDVCIETYKYNHPEIPENKVIQGDIRKIVDHIGDYLTKDIDIVIGGPPCQGFSSANQQRIIDDPRNELYKYFIKAVKKIAPKFVVMENVRGMLPYAEQIADDYKNISIQRGANKFTYSISYKVLISDDFGVAQKRQRLVFIAVRNDVAKKMNVSPTLLFNEIENKCKKLSKHVLNDAIEFIKPLDAPRIKNLTETDDEKTGKKIDINHFNGTENSYLKLINENRKIPFLFNHKARYTSDVNYEIYKRLNQGDDGTNEKIADIMPYAHRNHLFKDKYFKLIADKPSRTITAHLKMDCHSHIHPTQIRAITPREAARIQSFPDDYVFLGAYLKTYMQIGNAVPPLMARGIASVLKKYIN